MAVIPQFRGPYHYRLRCAQIVAASVSSATASRLRRGPYLPGWNWTVEVGTAVMRNHLRAAFSLSNVIEMRRYLDTLILAPQTVLHVKATDVLEPDLRGTWYIPENPSPVTLLYLHGGGFALYPKNSYAHFIAMLAQVTNTRTFAVDYRLSPEHRFPAQLDDVRNAYLWLLQNGTGPKNIVVAGDSAGGNLTLVLLCDLRDRKLPLPALGIGLSPATEFDTVRPSLTNKHTADWITAEMALSWRDWYCSVDQRSHPLVSPIHANLRGLPPIYIQAGRAEILYDSIAAFAAQAKTQGANLTFESWPSMNHVFQFFGQDSPQSAAALRRINDVIAQAVQPVAV